VTYQLIDGENVLMENNILCKIIGISSIKIKMHDDIVRTLGDVRRSRFEEKIIFWDTLDSNSYRFSAEGEF